MSLKKISVMVLAVLFVSSLSLAQTTGLYKKGGLYITPQIGLNSLSLPIGASVEFGLTENIGIGGTVTYWGWNYDYGKATVIVLSAEALYHLTKLKLNKLDLYGGAGLGYGIYSFSWDSGYGPGSSYSTGSSGLDLGIIIGGRYYFSPKMAVSLRIMNSLIGSWSTLGAAIGVTFVIQ